MAERRRVSLERNEQEQGLTDSALQRLGQAEAAIDAGDYFAADLLAAEAEGALLARLDRMSRPID